MGQPIKIDGLASTPKEQGKELKSIFGELTKINDEAISLLQKTYKQNVQLRKIIKVYRYVMLINIATIVYMIFRG